MNRTYEKIDESHSKMVFELQSDKEHSEWAHAFPEVMPSTHYLHHEWTLNPRGMPVLSVYPKLKSEAATNSADAELLAKLNGMIDADLATFAAENNIDLPPGKKSKAKVVSIILEGLKVKG